MRKVYKYTLKKTTEQDVIMPAGAVILSAAEQWGGAVLYALVDPDEQRLKPRRIFIHGTGHEVHAENLRFIGTVKFLSGSLMFHVFERVSE